MSLFLRFFLGMFVSNVCFADQSVQDLSTKSQFFQGLFSEVFSDLLNREINFDVEIKSDEIINMSGIINLRNKFRNKNIEYTFFPNGLAFKAKVSQGEDKDYYETIIGILFHKGHIYSGFLDEEVIESADLENLIEEAREWKIRDIKDKKIIRLEKINESKNFIELRKTENGYTLTGNISSDNINGKFQFTTSSIHYMRYEALKDLFNSGKKIGIPIKDKVFKELQVFRAFAVEDCDLSLKFADDEILGKKIAYITISGKEYESLLQENLIEKFSNNGIGENFKLELAENKLPDGSDILVYKICSEQEEKFFYEKVPSI
ncbi:MAG: hypothetical protein AB8G05_11300 [Oligoflexales bacterium]